MRTAIWACEEALTGRWTPACEAIPRSVKRRGRGTASIPTTLPFRLRSTARWGHKRLTIVRMRPTGRPKLTYSPASVIVIRGTEPAGARSPDFFVDGRKELRLMPQAPGLRHKR